MGDKEYVISKVCGIKLIDQTSGKILLDSYDFINANELKGE